MSKRDTTWGNNVLRHLTKPMYVIRMDQGRMNEEARIKWLQALYEACEDTQAVIYDELESLNALEFFYGPNRGPFLRLSREQESL